MAQELPALALPTPTAHKPRLVGLDALRGFALAGIVFVNIGPVLGLGVIEPGGTTSPVYLWLQDFVENRFFPIFSLLFGVSFAMIGDSTRTRPALVRRLIFLGLLGACHQILQPGEALLPYAVCGLVLLLPATFLPASAASRRWTAGLLAILGAGLLAAATITGGGIAAIPGLFLLGYAIGFLHIPARLAAWRHTSWLAGSATVVGVATALAVFGTTTQAERLASNGISAGLGLLMAATYVSGFIFLLTTPLRTALVTVFAPLGRMACTNYVSATLLFLGFRAVLGSEYDLPAGEPAAWHRAMLFGVTVLVLQWGWSVVWLRHFTYGPVEYLWRWVTWLERPRLSRTRPTSSAASVVSGPPDSAPSADPTASSATPANPTHPTPLGTDLQQSPDIVKRSLHHT